MLKIEIPKGFFENKSMVTVKEMRTMLIDMMNQFERIEEDYKYDLVIDANLREENYRLRKRIKELEEQLEGVNNNE